MTELAEEKDDHSNRSYEGLNASEPIRSSLATLRDARNMVEQIRHGSSVSSALGNELKNEEELQKYFAFLASNIEEHSEDLTNLFSQAFGIPPRVSAKRFLAYLDFSRGGYLAWLEEQDRLVGIFNIKKIQTHKYPRYSRKMIRRTKSDLIIDENMLSGNSIKYYCSTIAESIQACHTIKKRRARKKRLNRSFHIIDGLLILLDSETVASVNVSKISLALAYGQTR
ncbi:hypothetical protein [Glutamicibacter protophormiae]|uniref:Uncharacterized protein n=1 Tax=Glutamicibacter protophormiae TaxID=37930 RepID=A0ABS4XLG1_GLUPR|nr:hypothetical protein [Glutamicibacter protophormiae]MBP2397345.1 hypothetical protein [Glutamicibacter protophormiae]GGL79959.1 hypothetical protein GCM10010038_07470 [Glutamicibacter protophormiae]